MRVVIIIIIDDIVLHFSNIRLEPLSLPNESVYGGFSSLVDNAGFPLDNFSDMEAE